MTGGPAFAVYAVVLAIFAALLGGIEMAVHAEWQKFAYCGLLEAVAIVFALVSLRDR